MSTAKTLLILLCLLAPVASVLGGVARPSEKTLEQKIRDAAYRASLDPKLVEAVIKVESNFAPQATSRRGAMGLMQVMPKTAEECGINGAYHPLDNLMGACDCLRRLINRYQGNLRLALAAYNAGPHNVDRYKGVPPFRETRSYVKRILGLYEKLKKGKRPELYSRTP